MRVVSSIVSSIYVNRVLHLFCEDGTGQGSGTERPSPGRVDPCRQDVHGAQVGEGEPRIPSRSPQRGACGR